MFVLMQQSRSEGGVGLKVEPVGGLWSLSWTRLKHRGLAASQLVLPRGNSFSPSLHAELITAHNHTENVASVLKRAAELPSGCYSSLTQRHKKGGAARKLFVKYK